MNTTCHSCDTPSPKVQTGYGVITGLILALLPKCPFCVMAFTGTALLCGEGSVTEVSRTHHSLFTIAITGLFCLITLVGIGFNRRGNRTWIALALALSGIAMIMFSVIRAGGEPVYYSGLLILFFAAWLNGSFVWFLKTLGVVPGSRKRSEVAG